MNAYTPRFVKQSDTTELINLYHLARVPLSSKECTPYTRKESAKTQLYVSSTGAYKDLCGLLR